MLTQEENVEIKKWFKERGRYKIGSPLWDQHNDQLGKHLYKKLDFFIQACKRDWNKRYQIDLAEGESLAYLGLAKAMKFYGTKTVCQRSKQKEGQYVFTGKFKSSFTTYLTTVIHGLLNNQLRKMNRKPPIQQEFDKSTKKQFVNKFKGKKRQIPPHLIWSVSNIPVNSSNNSKIKYDSHGEDDQKDLDIGQEDMAEKNYEQAELLKQIYNKCSPFQQQILMYMYKGWKQKAIAQKMRFTPQAIDQMIRRLRRKFKRLNLWQNQ